MKEHLNLFTASFPYGNSETFLENEVEYLAKGFENIFIFPMNCKGKKRNLPKNVEAICLKRISTKKKKIEIIKKNLFPILSILIEENISNKGYNISFLHQLKYVLKFYFLVEQLEDRITKSNLKNSVFYSYWFEQWASVLSIAKRKGTINKFISRAHGFDVYVQRHKTGQILFRKLQVKQVKQVFCISKDGQDYLRRDYPKYKDKFELSYLGTKDYGFSVLTPTKELQLLSVSNIYPVKRIHLIIEILKNINLNVQWTHYGDGELMEEIKEKIEALPSNIVVHLKGMVSNAKMLNEIKNKYYDLLINVSESEGLPVSIMEAISFGIPVMATDVGGTSEIVNKKTGVLLDRDFNPNETVDIIERFLKQKARNVDFRKEVREFWKKNFDAEVSFTKFINQLKMRE